MKLNLSYKYNQEKPVLLHHEKSSNNCGNVSACKAGRRVFNDLVCLILAHMLNRSQIGKF